MRKLTAAAAAVLLAAATAFAEGAAKEICWSYFDGKDAGVSEAAALKCCREAAEQGDARSQYLLGCRLEGGKGSG